MRKPYRRAVNCFFIAACLSAALLTVGCSKKTQPNTRGPVPVNTVRVQSKIVPLVLETVGRTEGSKEVEIRARVSGILEKQLYTEGAVVKAGAVLFRIEREPFENALAHARAAVAEEQARNSQAHRNAHRLQELLDKHLVSRNDTDVAVSTQETSDAALLGVQANMRDAELNLSYTQVTAPIGGITGRALHSEGSLVTAGADSSLLTSVTQADPIWARFALSANEYEALRSATKDEKQEHLKVELLRNDGSVYPHEGRVNFTGSTVDTTLGTVQLRAEFPNPNLSLLPGEFVQVRLSGGSQAAITVPQIAVLQGAKGPFVWLVNAQGQAEQRDVKTGAWVGDDWRISEGLSGGETLIVDNLLKLRPGQAVQAQMQQQSTAQSSAASSAEEGNTTASHATARHVNVPSTTAKK